MLLSSKLWISAALLLVVGYVTSFIYWYSQVLPVESTPLKVAATEVRPTAPRDTSSIAMLFGTSQEKQSEEVKKSPLALKLVASYVMPEKKRSAAIITSDGDKQKLYYVGDRIQGDVELKAVQAGRILIKRNGVLESINLEGFSGVSEVSAAGEAANPVHVVATVPASKPAVNQDMLEKLKKLKSLAARDN
ncbi:type II secretory pathway component PulC [Pseudomonas sp. TE3786]